ncbi:MAG: hypothetical protein IBX55_17715 [Methyloprofundus sp.]|nr:hypothetical protein [Methyloprofundus sp.]
MKELNKLQIISPETLYIKTFEFAPLMHASKFAEISGLSLGVINGWIRQDYLPTVKIGKYSMINMISLTNQLSQATGV